MKFFLSLLSVIFLLPLSAVVIEAPHLDCIRNEITHLDSNALIVFDVDYTLIVPKDKIRAPCGELLRRKLFAEGTEKFGQERMKILSSIVLLACKNQLINPHILSVLEGLHQQGIKVIALTAVKSGSYGLIPCMEDWRLDQLDSLGLHFNKAFPQCPCFVLEKCQGQENPAVFKEGILFSGKYPKGEVLAAFLEKIQWKPSKILFIDDRMDFIDTVEVACARKEIPVISMHYTEALDAPERVDECIAHFQWEYLQTHEKWLSDEEALEKMQEMAVH